MLFVGREHCPAKTHRVKALGNHCSGKGRLFTKHYCQARIAQECKDVRVKFLPGVEQEPEENDCVSLALDSRRGVPLAQRSGDKASRLCLHLSRACQDQCRDSH